ncbi:MAG: hypothetical protein QOG94_776 [Solirubrobacteraceae bacterium]|nr:hypothetical protein [Solirubrobacteraceae bacterium]MEA2139653.1 hypothetical protein [Solirubrobacteraceae bacterium]
MPDQEGNVKGPGFTDTPDQAYKSGRTEDIQEGSLGADTGGADAQVSRLTEDAGAGDEGGTAQVGGFAGQDADDSPDAGTIGDISGEGDPSPHAGHEDNDTPSASADDAKIMDDAPAQQNANPGAAVSDQGYGQHDDQDATDVETKQDHPATPADMGNR